MSVRWRTRLLLSLAARGCPDRLILAFYHLTIGWPSQVEIWWSFRKLRRKARV